MTIQLWQLSYQNSSEYSFTVCLELVPTAAVAEIPQQGTKEIPSDVMSFKQCLAEPQRTHRLHHHSQSSSCLPADRGKLQCVRHNSLMSGYTRTFFIQTLQFWPLFILFLYVLMQLKQSLQIVHHRNGWIGWHVITHENGFVMYTALSVTYWYISTPFRWRVFRSSPTRFFLQNPIHAPQGV